MRFRKLRIAWSVFWGLAAVVLIALWVRSYSALESWTGPWLHVQSARGVSVIFAIDREKSAALLRKTHGAGRDRYSHVPLDKIKPASVYSVAIISSKSSPILYGGGTRICVIPFWTAVIPTVVLPCALWAQWPLRFSLRTLLIATTLVAVVLGLIVFAGR